MIKRLELTKVDNIMKIWLEANISVRDFIYGDYWNKNYDFVKKVLTESNVFVYGDNIEIIN